MEFFSYKSRFFVCCIFRYQKEKNAVDFKSTVCKSVTEKLGVPVDRLRDIIERRLQVGYRCRRVDGPLRTQSEHIQDQSTSDNPLPGCTTGRSASGEQSILLIDHSIEVLHGRTHVGSNALMSNDELN